MFNRRQCMKPLAPVSRKSGWVGIEPVLEALEARQLLSNMAWSTYVGGADVESAAAVVADPAGNTFVAGQTQSSDFPAIGTLGGYGDGFVAKLSPTGQLLWAARLGGSSDDSALGLAADSSGNVFVTGRTASDDFPTTAGMDQALGGATDAFVAKLDGATGAVIWSTLVGGTDDDQGLAVAVDADGNVFMTGETFSSDFPVTAGLGTQAGGYGDAFAVRLQGDSGLVVWATCLGGSDDDSGQAVAVDGLGSVVVAGGTWSADFPVTSGSPAFGGASDAFVAKFNVTTGQTTWATYMGGADADWAYGLATDSAGRIAVTGQTASTDFIVSGGFAQSLSGGTDAFVSVLDAAGGLAWSSFLGGSGDDCGNGVAFNLAGDIFVAGGTSSSDFPRSADPYRGEYDVFFSKVSGNGQSLSASAVIGGSANDWGAAVAVDWQGFALVAGQTESSSFPTTGGLDDTLDGPADAFVTKLAFGQAPTITTVQTLPGGVEDQDYLIPYSTLATLSDAADADGNPIAFRVESISSGTLTKDGTAVAPGTTLLASGDSLVWHPVANANGTLDAFTVRAWDGVLASATAAQVQVQVAAANDAPTLGAIDILAGATEDTDYTITYAALAAAANASDIDGDATSFVIEVVTSGTLTKEGTAVTPGMTLLGPGESVVWHPALNANGAVDAFSVKAWDGALASASAVQVQVQVAAVNDAPTLTAVMPLIGACKDNGFEITYQMLADAANAADLDGDPVAFRIGAIVSGTLTYAGQAAVPGGTLVWPGTSVVWHPARHAVGTLGAFMVRASDGMAVSAPPVQVQVAVGAVPDLTTTVVGSSVWQSAAPGTLTDWTATIKNRGRGVQYADWTVEWYLSSNRTYQATDTLIGRQNFSDDIAPGASMALTMNAAVPVVPAAGQMYVVARVVNGGPDRSARNNVRASVDRDWFGLVPPTSGHATLATAMDLGYVTRRSVQPGQSLSAVGQSIFYKFTTLGPLSAANYVRADFKNAEGDLYLRLYRDDGTQVGTTADTSRNREQASLNGLPEGTYYVEVGSSNGDISRSFNLTINAPAGADLSPTAVGSGRNNVLVSADSDWFGLDRIR